MRSLIVLFGAAFTIKYVLLPSLHDPAGGLARRLAGALLNGVTLGTVEGERYASVTGYIAFLTVALYFIAIWLLLQRQMSGDRALTPHHQHIQTEMLIDAERRL
jgi:hypothetical protein